MGMKETCFKMYTSRPAFVTQFLLGAGFMMLGGMVGMDQSDKVCHPSNGCSDAEQARADRAFYSVFIPLAAVATVCLLSSVGSLVPGRLWGNTRENGDDGSGARLLARPATTEKHYGTTGEPSINPVTEASSMAFDPA